MPQFLPDQVAFKDLVGYGAFDMGHYREHLQFIQSLAAQSPPVLLPDFDVSSFLTAGSARGSIIQSHAQAHNLLNATLGITAVDFSAFNFDDEDDFYNFTSYHSANHGQIRQQLGIF